MIYQVGKCLQGNLLKPALFFVLTTMDELD